MSNEDTVLGEGRITFDIRFTAWAPVSHERIRLIINVEAQGKLNTGYPMPQRGIFNCSRMISAQYGTEFVHSEYQNIKKVYSIFVCMNVPQKRKNTITRYRVIEENLVGNVKEPVQNYDLLSVVMVCLGGVEGENSDGVLKLLDVLLSPTADEARKREVLEHDFDIPMTETLEAEVRQMCNLSQGVMELGIEKGFLASIRNLMANTGWPLEKAMETLGLPEADRSKYADLLQKQ